MRKTKLFLVRGLLTFLGLSLFATVLGSGLFPCFSARYLKIPCPGCGSTRATFAVLSLDIKRAVLLNPLGPLMAACFFLFGVRIVLLMTSEGSVSRIGEGWLGKFLPSAMLALVGGECVIWVLRFFGFLGGPCPV